MICLAIYYALLALVLNKQSRIVGRELSTVIERLVVLNILRHE